MVGPGKVWTEDIHGKKREEKGERHSPQVEGTGMDRPPAEPSRAPPASIMNQGLYLIQTVEGNLSMALHWGNIKK